MAFTGVAPFTFTYTDGTTPVTVTWSSDKCLYCKRITSREFNIYSYLTHRLNNCAGVFSGSAVITVNLPPSLSLTGTNLICYNVATGAVDMTITDGTAPFGIAWTGPNGFTCSD